MPSDVRSALIGLGILFLAVAIYHRIRSVMSGDRLDRTKEGWPLMIGIRLTGAATFGGTIAWLSNPSLFGWAALSVPEWVRWTGVAGFAFSVFWLSWMFISLGSNLTDTVVTRECAHFVESGPYRFVRNPMYSGILLVGPSLGLGLGTWLLPVAATAMFWLLARRTSMEEKYLIARFGDQYREYMDRVGRFFPRWS
jgi:protein-S-isoprenylcysteine O-methyltransferase Ste14